MITETTNPNDPGGRSFRVRGDATIAISRSSFVMVSLGDEEPRWLELSAVLDAEGWPTLQVTHR
jgi:hypothetical protein